MLNGNRLDEYQILTPIDVFKNQGIDMQLSD